MLFVLLLELFFIKTKTHENIEQISFLMLVHQNPCCFHVFTDCFEGLYYGTLTGYVIIIPLPFY